MKSCVRQIEKGKETVIRWSLAAHRCLFRMGPRYGRRVSSVNRLRWLRMVCVDIRELWRPGVSATVLVDGLHWSHRYLRRICQSRDGVVPGGSPLHGWFQVAPSTVLKLVCSIPMVILCRRWWGFIKSFFVGVKCFCYVQLTSDYRRSDAWFK